MRGQRAMTTQTSHFEATKPCIRCGAERPMAEFYAQPQMSDGHLNVCKECVKARAHRHRQENIDRIREYDRNRPNAEARREGNHKRYREDMADPDKRAAMLRSKALWRDKNFVKRRAHIITGNAIRCGRINRQPCERCGSKDHIHAHHENYYLPLEVTWLCRDCHGQRHREINEMKRNGTS